MGRPVLSPGSSPPDCIPPSSGNVYVHTIVYIYIYIYTHTYTYTHCTCMHTYIYIYIYIYTYIYTHTWIYSLSMIHMDILVNHDCPRPFSARRGHACHSPKPPTNDKHNNTNDANDNITTSHSTQHLHPVSV